jgi:hypothetical protein
MCDVILDTILSAFMVQSGPSGMVAEATVSTPAQGRELISKIGEDKPDSLREPTALEESPDLPSPATSPQIGDVSRGYCVTIPDIGDIRISDGGYVVFNHSKITNPVGIVAPSSVVLKHSNRVFECCLDQLKKTTIDSLSFQSNDGNVTGLHVDIQIDLAVGNLSRRSALLINTGKIALNSHNA